MLIKCTAVTRDNPASTGSVAEMIPKLPRNQSDPPCTNTNQSNQSNPNQSRTGSDNAAHSPRTPAPTKPDQTPDQCPLTSHESL